jgi:tellurite resistance protein TerC
MASNMHGMLTKTLMQIKRIVILIIGCSVILIGIAMIVLPGPAIVVIPIGIGILATEFVWAGKVLNIIKQRLKYVKKQP